MKDENIRYKAWCSFLLVSNYPPQENVEKTCTLVQGSGS